MKITYPRKKSEFEIQAELFYRIKSELGLDIRGEVNIYNDRELWIGGKRKFKDRKSYCRPDLIIFIDKKPFIIIEVKRKKRGARKQLELYRRFCNKVILACGDTCCERIIREVEKLVALKSQ